MGASPITHPDQLRVLPEAIRPEQFDAIWHGRRPAPPEQSLLLAMLRQAFDDLRRLRCASRRADQRLFLDAYAWVMSNDRSHSFSFVNLCESLSLAPDAVRAGLLDNQSKAAA